MSNIIWKPIPGFENLYEINNIGKIRSLNRTIDHNKNGITNLKGKEIIPNKVPSGYLQVCLVKNKNKERFMLHRLVVKIFLDKPNKENIKHIPNEDISEYLSKNRKIEVNHKDENKLNCSVENLEWCTRAYNINYGNRNKKVGISSKKRAITDLQNKTGMFSEESHKKSAIGRTGKKYNSRKYTTVSVYLCLETNETLNAIEACEKYNTTKEALSLSANPNNSRKYAGKDSFGNKLSWKKIGIIRLKK